MVWLNVTFYRERMKLIFQHHYSQIKISPYLIADTLQKCYKFWDKMAKITFWKYWFWLVNIVCNRFYDYIFNSPFELYLECTFSTRIQQILLKTPKAKIRETRIQKIRSFRQYCILNGNFEKFGIAKFLSFMMINFRPNFFNYLLSTVIYVCARMCVCEHFISTYIIYTYIFLNITLFYGMSM